MIARMILAGAALLSLPAVAIGEAKPPASLLAGIFGDHGVLQRDRPIRIWGRASAGAAVTVTLGGEKTLVRADGDGRWEATLAPLPAGGPYTLVASADGVTQQLSDIMVGDVYLCSGQ